MRAPPDAERRPPAGAGATDILDAHRDPRSVEHRCQAGVACVEVVARLEAGHRVKYVEGCPDHGEELLVQARLIADVHRQSNELSGGSG